MPRLSERAPAHPAHTALPRTVVIVGLISLFNDFASEMVVPLIPLLLVSVLAAGPIALGLIEGSADAVSNLIKLWAGRRSDLYGRRRKPYIVLGYLLSNIMRPLIGVAGSWTTVLGLRITDRLGKGLRTAPRDALIADVVDGAEAGRAFGFARALDHAGAVLGALAAAAALRWGTTRFGVVAAMSTLPGFVAVGLAAFGLREPAAGRPLQGSHPSLRWSALERPARAYLLTIAVFCLGRIPETFVLLRGNEIGLSPVVLLLLWAAMQAVKALVSETAGRLADRHGRRPLLLTGWLAYPLALIGLALSRSPGALWGWSLILGLYFGLSEGAERALIRDLAPPAARGTAFGWFHMIAGLGAIIAGLLIGGLWSSVGAEPAFLVSAAITAVAWLGFWRGVRYPTPPAPDGTVH